MKRMMVWVLGLVASLMASLAFASATAVTINGSVSAQAGTGPVRVVRQGDTLRPGDTVSTGPGASAVLRFEDGQVAALGQNSRMVIQAFEYNAQAKSGNIVLNLLAGGMRAITGLIGRTQPTNVTYKAGNYTIGIRGTDVTIALSPTQNVAVTVNEGSIVFTIGGRTYTVTAGSGAFMQGDAVRTDVISAIIQAVQNLDPGLSQSLQNSQSVPVSATVPGAGAGAPSETVTGTVTSTPASSTGQGGGGTPASPN